MPTMKQYLQRVLSRHRLTADQPSTRPDEPNDPVGVQPQPLDETPQEPSAGPTQVGTEAAEGVEAETAEDSVQEDRPEAVKPAEAESLPAGATGYFPGAGKYGVDEAEATPAPDEVFASFGIILTRPFLNEKCFSLIR